MRDRRHNAVAVAVGPARKTAGPVRPGTGTALYRVRSSQRSHGPRDLVERTGYFMSPTTNLEWKRLALRSCLAVLALVAACGSDSAMPSPDAGPDPGPPPTYTELYTKYFAAGTPGHCAAAGCHLDSVNGWTCGTNKNTCYMGMVGVGAEIIDPVNPKASVIGDPKNSPVVWVNPSGNMPNDAVAPFPEGRAAILAWVAAGAQNN
jgi:hypothetical protein